MNGTRHVPSQIVLRYLRRQMSSKPCCSIYTSPSPYDFTNCRTLLHPPLRLGQQRRHLMLAQILTRGKAMASDHKLNDYTRTSIRPKDDEWWGQQKLNLWAEGSRGSRGSAKFLGITTLADVMQKYLGHGRTTPLGPPDKHGHGLFLVPNMEQKKYARYDRQCEDDLEDYILVRPKRHSMPKEITVNRGRGAKMFHLKVGASGDHIRHLLSKAYGYIQSSDANIQFHVNYIGYSMGEDEMTQAPGALAFRPELLAESLGAFLAVQPLTNGSEIVFIIKARPENKDSEARQFKEWDRKLTTRFEHLRKLDAAGQTTLRIERTKERAVRTNREKADIETLIEQGESYDHILEQRRMAEERNSEAKDFFAKQNFERDEKKRLKDEESKERKRRYMERRNLRKELGAYESSQFYSDTQLAKSRQSSWPSEEHLVQEDHPEPNDFRNMYNQAAVPPVHDNIKASGDNVRSLDLPAKEEFVQDDNVGSMSNMRYPPGRADLVRRVALDWETRTPNLRKIGSGDWDYPDERPISVRRVEDTEYPPVYDPMFAEPAEDSSSLDQSTDLEKQNFIRYHYSGDSAVRQVVNPDKRYWNRAQRLGHRSIF